MSVFKIQNSMNCQGNLIDLSSPKIMAIINITPDSFFDKSRANTEETLLNLVNKAVSDGADILDVGGYSSRPGAENITPEEEWSRLDSALNTIRKKYPDVLISVDTFRSSIAKRSVEEFDVNIINDISGGELDTEMFKTVGNLNTPYILMHMLGTPQNMQVNPTYKHIVQEMITYFSKKKELLLKNGVKDIIIDPGFGFGKTLDHNYKVLNRLDEFQMLELPILAGLSRKSMIFKLLQTSPEFALNGTVVLNTLALQKGARILRVHDVKEAAELVKLFNKVKESAN